MQHELGRELTGPALHAFEHQRLVSFPLHIVDRRGDPAGSRAAPEAHKHLGRLVMPMRANVCFILQLVFRCDFELEQHLRLFPLFQEAWLTIIVCVGHSMAMRGIIIGELEPGYFFRVQRQRV